MGKLFVFLMMFYKTFLSDNKKPLAIFFITFFVYSIFVYHDISSFDEAKKTNPALTSVVNLVHGDEGHYLSVTSDIVRHHSVYLEDFFFDKNHDPDLTWPEKYYDTPSMWEASEYNGHYVSILSPALSYILVIPYYLGGVTGSMITMNIVSSFTSLFIYLFVAKLTTKKIGFAVALFFSFFTLLLIYSNQIYDDVVFTLFLIAPVYFILEKYDRNLFMSMTGAILGFGLFLKPSFILVEIILFALIIFLMLRKKIKVKTFLLFIGFFSILSVMVLVNNFYTYHSWLGGDYEESGLYTLLGGNTNDIHANQFSHEAPWRAITLEEDFFGKFHGLFIFSPIVALFVVGIQPLWAKYRFHFIILSILILTIVSEYVWTVPIDSITGGDPPFRYPLPIVPLLAIPFAMGLQKFSASWIYRILFAFLLIPSFVLSVVFTVIRVGSLGHSPLKEGILHNVYRGIETIFPSAGPAALGSFKIPAHHPLDNYNIAFIILAASTLLAGLIIPFLINFKSKTQIKEN